MMGDALIDDASERADMAVQSAVCKRMFTCPAAHASGELRIARELEHPITHIQYCAFRNKETCLAINYHVGNAPVGCRDDW